MTDKELERLLKESKPMVKDDYGFMLEVIRRTSAIKGVKSEVDRQRKQWHKALWITFFIGIAAGILIYDTFAFLNPRVCYTVAVIAITITLVIVTTLDIKKLLSSETWPKLVNNDRFGQEL